ncbi:helix-turn-helix transcriptional regulator [uncultured Anaerococcus sp.]|uniref:helix-turn-helix domain-containing protein n=1 Tax=uncultured Anaerococcus sp. TaxID=293428 RepID=UPI00288AFB22|nr:helix-turn-helix transcriptional regulator [uncultured Anaerococcus sp.]
MTRNFRDTLNNELKNPEFKEEWDRLEPEFQIIKSVIDSRNELSMTQKDLSELTGIHQSEISKIENGSANPSLKTLERLASAFGKKLKISFEN